MLPDKLELMQGWGAPDKLSLHFFWFFCARYDNGTHMSFPPFPRIYNMFELFFAAVTGKETYSDNLIPVAYKTSNKH